MTKSKYNVWLISKYLRLPIDDKKFEDGFQRLGFYPARGYCLMRELSRRGHSVQIFTSIHTYSKFKKGGTANLHLQFGDLKVVMIKVIRFYKNTSIRRILSWLQFEWRLLLLSKNGITRPDVIICSSLSFMSIITGLYFRWKYSSKLIFEIRDIWPMVLIENGKYSPNNPFVKLVGLSEWLGLKYADRIVSTLPNLSPHVENVISYPRAVDCIPQGISEEMLQCKDTNLPKMLRPFFEKKKFIVCYAGSIGIDNALDILFEAAAILQENLEIEFLIIGGGDLASDFETKYSKKRNIKFHPPIPATTLMTVLKKCDVLFFSTHYTKMLQYGQSLNKVIDYMYSGRPILASHSGYPSMINEANCGTFIEAGDSLALAQCITDYHKKNAAELTEIGKNGQDWLLENRNFDRLTDDYEKVIKDLYDA